MNCTALLLIYSVKHLANHHQICMCVMMVSSHVEVSFEVLMQHVETVHLDVSDFRIIGLLQVGQYD